MQKDATSSTKEIIVSCHSIEPSKLVDVDSNVAQTNKTNRPNGLVENERISSRHGTATVGGIHVEKDGLQCHPCQGLAQKHALEPKHPPPQLDWGRGGGGWFNS